MSADVIDATGRFKRMLRVVPSLQVVEHAPPGAYETVILAPGITIEEFESELRKTGIRLDTSEYPFQFVRRA